MKETNEKTTEKALVDTADLLQSVGDYVSLTAISRVTGINKNLLSQYATRIKQPSLRQRQRILEGIHAIGERLQGVE